MDRSNSKYNCTKVMDRNAYTVIKCAILYALPRPEHVIKLEISIRILYRVQVYCGVRIAGIINFEALFYLNIRKSFFRPASPLIFSFLNLPFLLGDFIDFQAPSISSAAFFFEGHRHAASRLRLSSSDA